MEDDTGGGMAAVKMMKKKKLTLDEVLQPTIVKSKRREEEKSLFVLTECGSPRLEPIETPTTQENENLPLRTMFCDYVFQRRENWKGIGEKYEKEMTRQGQIAEKESEEVLASVRPLHFNAIKCRPPSRLNYMKVPHGKDYVHKYCGGCVFEDMQRCSFCQTAKLSATHRLPLARLASLLLLLEPGLTAKEMAKKVANYALNDQVCIELNEQIGWEPDNQVFCELHAEAREMIETRDLEQKKFYETIRIDLEAEKKNVAKLNTTLLETTTDLDTQRQALSKLESLYEQSQSTLLLAQAEVLRLREANAAQATMNRRLKEEVHSLRRPQVTNIHTQTGALWCQDESTQAEIPALGQSIAVQTIESIAKQRRYSCTVQSCFNPIKTEFSPDQEHAHDAVSNGDEAQADDEVDADQARLDEAGQSIHNEKRKQSFAQMNRRNSIVNSNQIISLQKKRRTSERLYSKIGQRHRGKEKTERLVPLATLLDMIHEVVEKKIVSTQLARSTGKEIEDLVDYIKLYFREKLGLRKLANKRVGEMIRALKSYAKTHSRVMWFAILLGVKTAKVDHEDEQAGGILNVPFVPWLAASTFDFLANVFDGPAEAHGVSELLSNYKKDFCVVDKQKITGALIGKTDFSKTWGHAVKYDDISTWKSGLLGRMLSPLAIRQFVSEVEVLPEIEAVPEQPTSTPQKRGISFDKVLELLLGYQVRAIIDHQTNLIAAFHRFDGGEPGLDIDEFQDLCHWAISKDLLAKIDVPKLYSKIEKLADAGLLDGENDQNINDSLTFPIVLMQQIPDCPLAHAAHCRAYWTLSDADDASTVVDFSKATEEPLFFDSDSDAHLISEEESTMHQGSEQS